MIAELTDKFLAELEKIHPFHGISVTDWMREILELVQKGKNCKTEKVTTNE
jgi:hypothetical protein